MAKYRHICEVCKKEEVLTSDEGFDAGWDYPPRMGVFGVISPRTCPDCTMMGTLWWRLTTGLVKESDLSEEDAAFIKRVSAEPESILVGDE